MTDIRTIMAVAPRVTTQRVGDSRVQVPEGPDGLTPRQREITRLVGQGLSNKDIADSTVRHHLTGIFDKVGVPNRQTLLLHMQDVRSSPV